MSTKAQMIAKFQEVYTGNPDITDWDEVEETLHTEPESILENIYGAPLTDTIATTNVFTSGGAGKTYRVRIFKQGRKVTVNGYVTNATGSALPSGTTFFSITTTEYIQETQIYFINGTSSLDGSIVRFTLSSDDFKTVNTIGNGETIYFEFSYNTLS